MGNSVFTEMMLTDLIPMIEKTYRALPGAANRAMAGLSMGGGQTRTTTMANLDKFAYIGVYSSGLFGAFPAARRQGAAPAPPPNPGPSWEEQNQAQLDNPTLKKGLRLFWFTTGVRCVRLLGRRCRTLSSRAGRLHAGAGEMERLLERYFPGCGSGFAVAYRSGHAGDKAPDPCMA